MTDQSRNETTRQRSQASASHGPVPHGRTAWDFVSEEFERIRRASVNWYRVCFVLLVIAAAGYSFVRLNNSVEDTAIDMNRLANQVEEIKTAAQQSAAAAGDMRNTVVAYPSWSSYLGRTELNAVACKARGLESLESAGVAEIDVSQSGTVWGKLDFGRGVGRFTASVHCRDNMVNLFVVGPDYQVAKINREKIERTFLEH